MNQMRTITADSLRPVSKDRPYIIRVEQEDASLIQSIFPSVRVIRVYDDGLLDVFFYNAREVATFYNFINNGKFELIKALITEMRKSAYE